MPSQTTEGSVGLGRSDLASWNSCLHLGPGEGVIVPARIASGNAHHPPIMLSLGFDGY